MNRLRAPSVSSGIRCSAIQVMCHQTPVLTARGSPDSQRLANEKSMNADSLAFLRRLLETPSPSGYEQPVQAIVREYVKSFADRVTTDVHGNVIAARNPDARLRVMLAGHADQIGFLVQYVDEQGFI